MDKYSEIQPHVKLEIKNALEVYSNENKYTLSNIPVHEHSGKDSVPVVFDNLDLKKIYITKSLDGTEPQTAGNFGVFYIAPFACAVSAVYEAHQTAGTDGSAVTLNIEKLTSGTAAGSGVNVLGSEINLKATANITQTGVLTNTLANRRLKKGERLALKKTGTLTALVGVCIIIEITY